ncbi:hypothetical protein SAMN05216309_10946 [Nitrosomonas europaea]|nr:hypothetical protein SAMN05216310_10946 [Nitrosomonas europaea]SES91943.1 hypothetical protein SAMN05216309_10946 [Nitrosomonas europaea]SJZ42917.1 hypothetical protein SAMN02745113_00885 [Nitrosomonas europaea]
MYCGQVLGIFDGFYEMGRKMKTGHFYLMVKNIRSCLVLMVLSCFTVQTYAEDVTVRLSVQNIHHPEWERATDEELAVLRGGFVLPNGVHIDMSLEKFIHLNDVLVHSSSLQLPGAGVVLQAGMQNMVSDSITVPELSTFVQNTLDSQHIEALTTINIEVSNLKGIAANGGGQQVFTEFLAPALLR